MIITLRRTWLPASAFALTALAFPQGGSDCFGGRTFEDVSENLYLQGLCDGLVSEHGGLTPGSSIAPAIADFNGDLRPDAFLIVQGQPFLSVSPGAIDMNYSLRPLELSSAASATAAYDFNDGSSPAMVASTDAGLQFWDLDPNGGVPTTNVAVDLQWSNAAQLLTDDFDNDGKMEILGVFYRGLTQTEFRIGRLVRDSQGDIGFDSAHIPVAQTFPIPLPFVDTVDWDPTDSERNVTVVFQQRVYVFDGQLGLVGSGLLAEGAVAATAINDDTGAGIAIVTHAAGNDSLVVLRPGGFEPAVSLGAINTTQMITADGAIFDKGDLVIRCDDGIRGLANSSRVATQAFDGTLDKASFNLDDVAVLNDYQPWLAAADLDNDGDADLLLHNSRNYSVMVARSLARLESTLTPRLGTGTDALRTVTSLSTSPAVNRVTFELHRIAAASMFSNATHIYIEAWDPRLEADYSDDYIPISEAVNDALTVSFDIPMEGATERYTMILARAVTVDPVSALVQSVGPDLCMFMLCSTELPPGGVGEEPAGTDPDPPSRNAGGGGPPTPPNGG